jgi:hypothetical protein
LSPGLLLFVFGFCAGYTAWRLGRGKRLMGWEKKLLRPLGWILMSASFALAAVLLLSPLISA